MTKYTVKSELTDTPWQIENRTKKHKFMADESASGKNVAPNPVEYLAGAKLQHKQLLPNWAMENPLLVKC